MSDYEETKTDKIIQMILIILCICMVGGCVTWWGITVSGRYSHGSTYTAPSAPQPRQDHFGNTIHTDANGEDYVIIDGEKTYPRYINLE